MNKNWCPWIADLCSIQRRSVYMKLIAPHYSGPHWIFADSLSSLQLLRVGMVKVEAVTGISHYSPKLTTGAAVLDAHFPKLNFGYMTWRSAASADFALFISAMRTPINDEGNYKIILVLLSEILLNSSHTPYTDPKALGSEKTAFKKLRLISETPGNENLLCEAEAFLLSGGNASFPLEPVGIESSKLFSSLSLLVGKHLLAFFSCFCT